MAIPLLGRGGDASHPKIHIYTYVLNIYTHRCAKGTDEDGWGGPIAPINGLIMAATQDGTPCWEEIHPMKEFGKYGNTLPGNWNRVRSMEMNHLIVVVVRGGKNSESGAVDSVLCLFVCVESSGAAVTVFPIDLQTETDKASEIPRELRSKS